MKTVLSILKKYLLSQLLLLLVLTGTFSTGHLLTPSPVAADILIHNSANLGTKYGAWGTTYTCSTCHGENNPNIKLVNANIGTSIGTRPVVFMQMTATVSTAPVMGNDQRTAFQNGSRNICEVCHHNTLAHNYSASKVGTDKNHMSSNNKDCTSCHPHSVGFKPTGGGHEYSFGGSRHMPGGTGSKTAASTIDFSACTGCHYATSGGTYPVSGRGVASNLVCTVCHINNPNFYTTGSKGTCGDCHGSNTVGYYSSGQPDGNAFPNISGSHSAHITQGYSCDNCHNNRGTGHLTHGNYSGIKKTTYTNVSVAFNTVAGPAAKWNNGAGTLSNTSCSTSVCHGSKSPAWGAPVPAQQCVRCHGSQTLSYPVNNFSSAIIAPGGSNIDTGRNSGTTVRGGMHQEHLNALDGMSSKVKCGSCHAGLATKAVNHAKLDNLTTATIVFSGVASSSVADGQGTPGVVRTGGVMQCNNTWCHAPKKTSIPSPGGSNMAPTWNSTTYLPAALSVAACSTCHALPPVAGTSHTGLTVTTFPIGTQCGSNCHTNMNTAATTYATIFNDPTLHINGKIEGGDCLSCHGSTQGHRKAVVGDFASQSHHIQGAEVLTKASCYKCHWEADINGDRTAYHAGGTSTPTPDKGVELVVWTGTSRPTTYVAGNYVTYTANGKRQQIKKLNDVCLGCHNSANIPASSMFGTFASDQYSPEQNMVNYPKAKTSILSRYSSTRTVAWSGYAKYSGATAGADKYGTNSKANIKKALSAHGNAAKNQMLAWDTTFNGGDDMSTATAANKDYTYSGTSGNRNVFCYDCHNSHGSNATGITSSYSSATGRYKGGLLKSTIAGQGGYTVTYKPAQRVTSYKNYSTTAKTTSTFEPGANICLDCHNNQSPRQIASITKPWNVLTTYSTTLGRSITGYWSTPYFDNYTVNPAKRTVYKRGGGAVEGIKDMTKPMGGHFGASVATSGYVAGQTNVGSALHSREINGLCSGCHDPHGVSNALGADRDHGVPLLKGTWVTTPYREDRAVSVKRGGGSGFGGVLNGGNAAGYHIDQNTFVVPTVTNAGAAPSTAKSNLRKQYFTAWPNNAKTLANAASGTMTATQFAGLCLECHQQANLSNSTVAASTGNWRDLKRVHNTVTGWGATTGTGQNVNNTIHAFTCSKCHAPHVSRLPRLLVTNCLDARHVAATVSSTITTGINTTAGSTTANAGNISVAVASGSGAGRFPGGGARWSGTPATAQNPGGWWFQTTTNDVTTNPGAYGTTCHNSATSGGGSTWAPKEQRWNKKSAW